MHLYPARVLQRAMKIKEVITQAMSGTIHWIQAAEILGMSGRKLRSCGRVHPIQSVAFPAFLLAFHRRLALSESFFRASADNVRRFGAFAPVLRVTFSLTA